MQDQVTVTRGNLGLFASFVAALALLGGFLAAVWYGEFNATVIVILGIGVLSLVAWAVLTPREFTAFFTGRQARRATVAVFSTGLVIGIVVLAYVIIERAVITTDLTNAGNFTLSQATYDLLERVNRPIEITGFYTSQSVASRDLDDQYYRLYTAATDGLISRRYIDPDEKPDEAARFGGVNGDVFVSFLDEDGSIDTSTTQLVPRLGKQERDMSNAINTLVDFGNFVAYFTTGHGELDPLDFTGIGMSNATSLLAETGYITRPLDLKALAENGELVPSNATVLVIAGPQEPFSEEVVTIIGEYLRRGGALYLMTDATSSGDSLFLAEGSAFNDYLWDNWGIRPLDAVVVDELVSDTAPWEIISYAIYDSPITASLDPVSDPAFSAQFSFARPIEINPDPPVNNGAVIQTSEVAYGERDLNTLLQSNTYDPDPEVDIPGPLTTVAYAIDLSGGGQIVLVGDRDFVSNGRIVDPIGNGFLFKDGIDWISGLGSTVEIGSQAFGVAQPFILQSPSTLDQIAFVTMVLMPGFTLLLGFGVWFRRSRR